MDYPKSVPNVGLVDGKFIDENTVTGAVGSLIPSAWGNAVTDEILTVIKAAGIAPSEGATDQLLKAIRGSSLFVTPPQFDASKSVATAEFVQRSLGNLRSETAVNSSTTLGAIAVGQLIVGTGVTPFTTTLPLAASVNSGSQVHFLASAPISTWIVQRQGADILDNNAGGTYIVLGLGDTATFESNGVGTWRLIDGSASLRKCSDFSASLGANGYQKYPSGLVEQWGSVAVADNGEVNVVLPTAFPNAIFGAVVSVPLSAQAGAAEFSIAGVRKNGSSLNSILVNANSGPTTSVNPVIFWRVWGY